MTENARRRAESCFALARSSTFPAEIETAIARGKAIASAAGLDLGLFDIPGEERGAWSDEKRRRFAEAIRRPAASRYAEDLFTRPRAPDRWTQDELDDAYRRFHENVERTIREAAAEGRAREAEALERVRAERDRRLAILREAINHLWSVGVRLYPMAGVTLDGRFLAPEVSSLEYDGEGVAELARARGWNR